MSDEKHPWRIFVNFLVIEHRRKRERGNQLPADYFYVHGDEKVLRIQGDLPIPHLPDWTYLLWKNLRGGFVLKTTQIEMGGEAFGKTRGEMNTTYSGQGYVTPLLRQHHYEMDEARQQLDQECQIFVDEWSWDGLSKNNIDTEIVTDWRGRSHLFPIHKGAFERLVAPEDYLYTSAEFEEKD